MRILKKISALLLTVTLVLSLAPFAAVAAEGITLATIDQIATETPAGSGNWVMNADVTVSSNTPIAFSGTLDGNGHTISGLTQPLFANPTTDVTVKNLEVTAAITSESESGTGTFFCTVSSGAVNFEKVTVNGAVTSKKSTGGFVGLVSGGTLTVTDCQSNAAVKSDGNHSTGSLIGGMNGTAAVTVKGFVNNGRIDSANLGGGLIGRINGGTASLTYVTNNGAVYGASNVGGIVGGVDNATATLQITGAVNTGAVTGSSAAVGGICGQGGGAALSISSALNTGAVASSSVRVGGIIGNLQCASGVKATLQNVANIGQIITSYHHASGGTWCGIGGIVGVIAEGTLEVNGAFNGGELSLTNTTAGNKVGVGGIIGATSRAAELKNCVQADASGSATPWGAYAEPAVTVEATSCYNVGTATLDIATINTAESLADFRKVFGNFVEVNGEITIGDTYKSWNDQADTAVVKVRGVQKGLDGTSVRLIAEVKGLNYSSAGFKVTLSYTGATSDEKEITVNYAYTALYAEGSKLLVQPTEAGNYLIALVITDIDATAMQSLNVTFTPFAQANGANASTDGETVVYNVAAGTVTLAD